MRGIMGRSVYRSRKTRDTEGTNQVVLIIVVREKYMRASVLFVLLLCSAGCLVGCSAVGKNITDVVDGSPSYLTHAEIIDLVAGEVLRETPSNSLGRIKFLRRYMEADGRTVLKTYSDVGVIQKTFYGTWHVEDDGTLVTEYDIHHLTIPVSSSIESYNARKSADGKRSVKVVKISGKYSYHDKYANVRKNGAISTVWYVE
jgi:hypothetical protein